MLKEFGFTEWRDVTNLLTAQSGKEVLSRTHRLLKDRGFLIISKKEEIKSNNNFLISEDTLEISSPIHLKIAAVSKIEKENKSTIHLDKNSITFPLTLRKWQYGDFFYPKGMQGKKKISKFFKDEKYSSIDKENTWLLCTENNITWVIGKRQDNRFFANEKTKSILKIELL